LFVLSLLIVPFGLSAAGGFAGLHQKLPASYFQVFSSAGGELAAFPVAKLVLSGLVEITVQVGCRPPLPTRPGISAPLGPSKWASAV
jgi:hypothetical protein